VSQIFAGRLNLRGEWVEPPQRISNAGVRSLSPQLVILPDGSEVIAYIEKSERGGIMVAAGRTAPQRIVAAVGDMRQLALSSHASQVAIAWSENREKQPYIYSVRFTPRDGADSLVRLSVESALATQPTLSLMQDVRGLFYFTDDNRYVDWVYRRFASDGSPLAQALVLSHRAQTGSVSAYPVFVVTAASRLYVFETLSGVRLTRFDVNGARLDAQPITLEGVRTAGAVDAKISGDPSTPQTTLSGQALWVSWSETRRGKAAQSFVRPFTLDGKPQASETRLTFTTSGAFQPTWFMDNAGTQHIFWIENINDGEAALFYANTAQPAAVSVWQRLGFAGESPFANLLFTIAAAFMYAIPLIVAFSWRMGLVMSVMVLAYRVRFVQASPYRPVILFAMLIVAELWLSAPTTELVGQAPIALSGVVHGVFFASATVVTLWTAWQWRKEMSDLLRWPALVFVWTYLYYWLNALVILREAYAV
jgi:hypothetical protein